MLLSFKKIQSIKNTLKLEHKETLKFRPNAVSKIPVMQAFSPVSVTWRS